MGFRKVGIVLKTSLCNLVKWDIIFPVFAFLKPKNYVKVLPKVLPKYFAYFWKLFHYIMVSETVRHGLEILLKNYSIYFYNKKSVMGFSYWSTLFYFIFSTFSLRSYIKNLEPYYSFLKIVLSYKMSTFWYLHEAI